MTERSIKKMNIIELEYKNNAKSLYIGQSIIQMAAFSSKAKTRSTSQMTNQQGIYERASQREKL